MSEFTLSSKDFKLKPTQGLDLLNGTLGVDLLTPLDVPNPILEQTVQDFATIDAVMEAQQEDDARRRGESSDRKDRAPRGTQDATDIDKAADRVADTTKPGQKAGASTSTPAPTSISTKATPPTRTREIGALEHIANKIGTFASELAPTTFGDALAIGLAGPVVGGLGKAAYDTALSDATPASNLIDQTLSAIDDVQEFSNENLPTEITNSALGIALGLDDPSAARRQAEAFSDLMDSAETQDAVDKFDRDIERERSSRGGGDRRGEQDHGGHGDSAGESGGDKSGHV